MEDKHTAGSVDWTLLSHYIGQLQGVLYTSLVPDEAGVVTELHVLADRSRSPKQIVRDIQSVAMARFDLAIDHKVVSVAQIQGEDRPCAETCRLAVESFSITRCPDGLQAQVTLRQGEQFFCGKAEALSSARERDAVLARATLDALTGYLGGAKRLSLVEVRTAALADGEVVLVCLAVTGAQGQDLLVGAAFVWEDPQMAVIRATLSAVNRRLPYLVS